MFTFEIWISLITTFMQPWRCGSVPSLWIYSFFSLQAFPSKTRHYMDLCALRLKHGYNLTKGVQHGQSIVVVLRCLCLSSSFPRRLFSLCSAWFSLSCFVSNFSFPCGMRLYTLASALDSHLIHTQIHMYYSVFVVPPTTFSFFPIVQKKFLVS